MVAVVVVLVVAVVVVVVVAKVQMSCPLSNSEMKTRCIELQEKDVTEDNKMLLNAFPTDPPGGVEEGPVVVVAVVVGLVVAVVVVVVVAKVVVGVEAVIWYHCGHVTLGCSKT